jgi:hypothetical protein
MICAVRNAGEPVQLYGEALWRQEGVRAAAVFGTEFALVGVALRSRDPLWPAMPLTSVLALVGVPPADHAHELDVRGVWVGPVGERDETAGAQPHLGAVNGLCIRWALCR